MGQRRVECEGRTDVWTSRDMEMFDLAKRARVDRNLWLAEQLLMELLHDHPHHPAVVVQLSGVLRDRGRFEEALTITAPFVSSAYVPIFTARAAALCELGRWKEARQEVARALAIAKEDEALVAAPGRPGRISSTVPSGD